MNKATEALFPAVQHAAVPSPNAGKGRGTRRYLFNPLVDFLCLGGFTPLLFLLVPHEALAKHLTETIAATIVFYFVNTAHFANTYQLFYRDFHKRVVDASLSPFLRVRYWFAGVVCPLALTIFIIVAVLQPDTRMIGYVGNMMLFLLGWHYIKQGYGILIIDSVYKKRFFSRIEKWVFRVNNFSCWMFFWVLQNKLSESYRLFSITYHSLPLPELLINIASVLPLATSLAVGIVLLRRLFSRKNKLPVMGVLAYLNTVYVWVFGFFQPVLLLFIPILHSLQYQAVVWRYEINRQEAAEKAPFPPMVRACLWGGFAVALGYLGFQGVPYSLDTHVNYDQAVFGTALFSFIFWTFINIHHFVMDGVIWRADNPATKTYLFGYGQNNGAALKRPSN